MKPILFTKASACGNDFLIINEQHAPKDIAEFTRRVCDRHNGVGADGVEWLSESQEADAAIRLINSDGSEAEISGNGTRCVAAYLAAQIVRDKLTIETGAGLKVCSLVLRNGNMFEFETEMGEPKLGGPATLELASARIAGTQVSMGNPHFVIFVDQFPTNWREQAGEIQEQRVFSQGVNVEYVRILERNAIEVRFYERGAGETQSSGTGSCAAAVAAISGGKVSSPVSVHAPGGTQIVRWEKAEVFLRGPAQIICQGEYFAG
jgi:diaminopimelate epimerase